MKKIVIVCGLIAGFITGGWTVFFIYISQGSMDFENGMLYGYLSMLVAFSFVFVGIKNYRDNVQGGQITFGKAFKVGVLITVIASTVYVGLWLIEYFFVITDFTETYTAHELTKLKAAGASAAEIAKKSKEMAEFSQLYKNPFMNALMTYCEILPVGLIVALLAAAILRKKPEANDIAMV
jgi:hypothetical protein